MGEMVAFTSVPMQLGYFIYYSYMNDVNVRFMLVRLLRDLDKFCVDKIDNCEFRTLEV